MSASPWAVRARRPPRRQPKWCWPTTISPPSPPAVREGRIVYDNLVKVIGWTLPTNGGPGDGDRRRCPVGRHHADDAGADPVGQYGDQRRAGVSCSPSIPPSRGIMAATAARSRAPPLLSGLLVWRTAAGVGAVLRRAVFAVFTWALRRGEELEHSTDFRPSTRWSGLEIAYLFSVRLRHGAPFDFVTFA